MTKYINITRIFHDIEKKIKHYLFIIHLRFIRLKYIILYKRGKVDLRNCKSGDILISARGSRLQYLKRLDLPDGFDFNNNYSYRDPYPHQVEFINTGTTGRTGKGSRTDKGEVYKSNKMVTDHDIIRIMH